MYDPVFIVEILRRIAGSLDEIAVWTGNIGSDGMILLNAVCMKLLTVGEEVKSLDRRTGGRSARVALNH